MPLVDTISSPDYLNQMLCWWLEELSGDIEEVSANLFLTIKEVNLWTMSRVYDLERNFKLFNSATQSLNLNRSKS